MIANRFLLGVAIALAAATPTVHARDASTRAAPAHGVIDVDEMHLAADFWIARLATPDAPILDRAAIRTQNERLFELDRSMHDLRALPPTLSREQVVDWIDKLAEVPRKPLHDERGEIIATSVIDAIVANRNIDAIAGTQELRHGLVVQRADLRAFPTRQRVFRTADDTDIDRFQESALFPGTPVVIVHTSRDGLWSFVVSPRYAAWIETRYVATGTAGQVFGHAEKTPYRIITGADVHTVFTREAPAVSKLRLDMGVRVPVLADWPSDRLVNGQHPYAAHVIELPVRTADGSLAFAPALLRKNADSASDYLPLTRANLIRQAFKFLGERYGWGHAYEGRDCSGFVSEVYRSMGVEMPRNTSAQGVSPALAKRIFEGDDDRATRLREARAVEVGDLVYIPGHVMLTIGHVDGEPWMIHDTTGISYRKPDGSMARVRLNSVSVTPLLPLQFSDTESYVDRMRSIVRIRPDTATRPAGHP